ncbi:hypothetical protein [Roseimarinus sediminis]|uniref:hypothetical protein n=1 Tax=Roseimarinus sediminis TaxID=1610899 RepID=UPI003D1B70EC
MIPPAADWAWMVKSRRGFTQNLVWFHSRSSVVLLNITHGFAQNQAWFLAKAGVVFSKSRRGFFSSGFF